MLLLLHGEKKNKMNGGTVYSVQFPLNIGNLIIDNSILRQHGHMEVITQIMNGKKPMQGETLKRNFSSNQKHNILRYLSFEFS